MDAKQLLSFELLKVLEEWKAKAPLFLKIITSAITSNPVLQDKHKINLAFAGSALLRSRNQKMSAISHIVGLLLDYGGANDETIQRLCCLGVSVSSDAVYLKKKEISKLHDQQIADTLTEYKSTLLDIEISKSILESIEELNCKADTCTLGATDLESHPCTQELSSVEVQDVLLQEITPIAEKIVYSNPILSDESSQASLTTGISDIMMICKNTENVNLLKLPPKNTEDRLQYHSESSTLNTGQLESVCINTADTKNTKKYTEEFSKRNMSKIQNKVKTEIYGDNCDLRVNRSHQSKDQKAKDFHWFIALAAEQRVKGEHLSEERPQKPISMVSNEEFLPSAADNNGLQECFSHHVQKVLVENINCLNKFDKITPQCIEHQHMDDYRKKSEYFLIDLYDKNESKNEDMIDILSDLQQKCIPFMENGDKKNVIERKVFGGDVLTNERAYQAQLDMANGEMESDKLLSFIHRPEGLHRLMNLLKYIFDTFYLTSSVNEQGTMYQLKCLLDRRDVKVDMTSSYRQCKNFFDDILDGHIIAAACHYFGMKDQSSLPTKNKIPLYIDNTSTENQQEWLNNASKSIIDIYVMEESTAIPDIYEDAQYMSTQLASLTELDVENKYKCPYLDCTKAYKQFHWLKRHLKEKHNITVNINPPQHSSTKTSSNYDGVYNVASAFMKVGLLFRDTEDAYKMGDGIRLIRNARFELLHFHQGHHIKYRLWMWRVLAYFMSILSEREAYEYQWNMSFNIGRGIGHLIPNDNLVEMNVHLLKDQCRKMGANITFEGCRRWVKCLKYLSDLSDVFDKATIKSSKSGKHAKAKRQSDIAHVVAELNHQNVFEFTLGREHASFPNFSSDLLASVNSVELNEWLSKNKKRAEKEMQT